MPQPSQYDLDFHPVIKRIDLCPSYNLIPEITENYPDIYTDPGYLLVTTGALTDLVNKKGLAEDSLKAKIEDFCSRRENISYYVGSFSVGYARNGNSIVYAIPTESTKVRVQDEMNNLGAFLRIRPHKHARIPLSSHSTYSTAKKFSEFMEGFNTATKDEPLLFFSNITRAYKPALY